MQRSLRGNELREFEELKKKQSDRREEAKKCFTDQGFPQWDTGHIQRERQGTTGRKDSIVRGVDAQQDTLGLREVPSVLLVHVDEKFRVWPEMKREPRLCHK